MYNWHKRYLEIARHVATWSKDPDAKVGAVIADKNRRVVALGFNGFPVGIEDRADRYGGNQKLDMVVHAEENAILIAGRSAEGGTIYVHGKPVCSRCAGLIIQAVIKTVVASQPNDPDSKWYNTGLIAKQMVE